MDIEEAKLLKYRDVVVDPHGKRWYVNGKVKLWKRDAKRIQIPVKHGLYTYGYIDETTVHLVEKEI